MSSSRNGASRKSRVERITAELMDDQRIWGEVAPQYIHREKPLPAEVIRAAWCAVAAIPWKLIAQAIADEPRGITAMRRNGVGIGLVLPHGADGRAILAEGRDPKRAMHCIVFNIVCVHIRKMIAQRRRERRHEQYARRHRGRKTRHGQLLAKTPQPA